MIPAFCSHHATVNKTDLYHVCTVSFNNPLKKNKTKKSKALCFEYFPCCTELTDKRWSEIVQGPQSGQKNSVEDYDKRRFKTKMTVLLLSSQALWSRYKSYLTANIMGRANRLLLFLEPGIYSISWCFDIAGNDGELRLLNKQKEMSPDIIFALNDLMLNNVSARGEDAKISPQ